MEDILRYLSDYFLWENYSFSFAIENNGLEVALAILHDHEQPRVLHPRVMVPHNIRTLYIRQRSQSLNLIQVLLDRPHNLNSIDSPIHPIPTFLDHPKAPRPKCTHLLIVSIKPGILLIVLFEPVLLLFVGLLD